ncbi:hypothetical protein POV27_06250 [Aureisphaera galaxeae]|uniref:hypothetical protein n=1 Tax=Aureisphaera galaxeae TaxID=1538023 RepID=UPI002350CF7A|nr:hypothetical protein [Aureisphaera galaxeae]MDC8003645.1 hypothetical protein [Aureisphaera galaxeae]
MNRRFLLAIGIPFFLYACTSNTFDDISEPMEPVQEEETVTFQDVRFVFENICQACHSNPPQNGAPMPLVTYNDVRNAVLDRGLLDRISRQEGAPGLMPLGGPRLPQETIDLIMQWSADGLPEN